MVLKAPPVKAQILGNKLIHFSKKFTEIKKKQKLGTTKLPSQASHIYIYIYIYIIKVNYAISRIYKIAFRSDLSAQIKKLRIFFSCHLFVLGSIVRFFFYDFFLFSGR